MPLTQQNSADAADSCALALLSAILLVKETKVLTRQDDRRHQLEAASEALR